MKAKEIQFKLFIYLVICLWFWPAVLLADGTIPSLDKMFRMSLASGGGVDATPSASPEEDLEKIAKMTANPVGAAWMLWFQNDYSEVQGDLVDGKEYVNSTKFQPVISFPFKMDGEDWNFILRPVLQYQSVPLSKDVGKLFGMGTGDIIGDPELGGVAATAFDDRTYGMGDTALLTLVGPDRLDGFIWGVGATQIFPTAHEDVLGQEKWQAGPAVLVAKLAPDVGGFNLGFLAQHWWSYAGESDRDNTSMTDVQYFINYRLSKTELIGMTPNIRYNWEADSDDALTLPVGIGYSNVIKIGKLPVRWGIEYQHMLIKPDNLGSEWNIRLLFIPVIPNPFK